MSVVSSLNSDFQLLLTNEFYFVYLPNNVCTLNDRGVSEGTKFVASMPNTFF